MPAPRRARAATLAVRAVCCGAVKGGTARARALRGRWPQAVAWAALLTACARGEPHARPDVLLVTWDTARADHVGPDAAVAGLTPNWNAVAGSGVRFTLARTSSPSTLPAHASLMTGSSPPLHGVRENALFVLPDSAQTLAEKLGSSGWTTGAFVSAAVLDEQFGLAQGFSRYDDRVGAAHGRDFGERRGEATVEAALAWLRDVPPEEPVFLWVHLFDPHGPWSPPPDFASKYPGQPYRAEIAYVDAQTGRLLDGLRAAGRLDRALVVLTADHGEGLGEHGERTHGYFLYDSTVRIPLCIWAGPRSGIALPPGRRIDAPVSITDLAPTLVDLLALGSWSGDGVSLRAWLEGGAAPPRELALETVDPYYVFGSAPLFGVVDTAGDVWIDAPRRELYDIPSDPVQLHDLYAAARAGEADALFARHPRAFPPPRLDPPTLAREAQAQLEALGYLAARGGASAGAAPRARPDPKDLLPVAALWMDDHAEKTPAAALAHAEALAKRFGPLPALAFYRADRLGELARPGEAIAVLRESSDAYPDETRLESELRDAVLARERDRELAQRIRATLAAHPDHPGAVHDLAVVLHRLGELDEAARWYRVWLERHPDDGASRLELFRLLGAQGDYEGALAVAHAAPKGGRTPALACAEGRLLAWWLERPEQALPSLRACRDAGEPVSPREVALLDASAR